MSGVALALVALLAAAPVRRDPFAATEQAGARIANTVDATLAATRALLAKPHKPPHANTFFALLRHQTWYVYFGWLPKSRARFTPALVVSAPQGHPERMALLPLAKAPKDVLPEARAVAAARDTAAKATHDPRVDPVLVVRPKEIDVYVLQGPGRGAVLLGGDFLFRFDPSGTKLLQRIRYHKAIIPIPIDDPKHPAAGSFHTHISEEGPTPTDVAQVLLHPELAPMYVLGKSGKAYEVDEKGRIRRTPRLDAHRAHGGR